MDMLHVQSISTHLLTDKTNKSQQHSRIIKMGTPALIRFRKRLRNGKCHTIACVSHSLDGHLSKTGFELASFLMGFTTFNAFTPSDRTLGRVANGIECLAAQWIAHAKKEAGYVYVVSANTSNEAFTYTINLEDDTGELSITARFIDFQLNKDKVRRFMSREQFLDLCRKAKENDDTK